MSGRSRRYSTFFALALPVTQAPLHNDDVVLVIMAADAEARLETNRHFGNVAHQDRRLAAHADHGVANVVH